MYIIAENIHIISPSVKAAIAERDAKFFQDLAVRMVDAGASAVDLNIGPQKKSGHEILPWLVETVEEVVDVPLVFDTTRLMLAPSDWSRFRLLRRSTTLVWLRSQWLRV